MANYGDLRPGLNHFRTREIGRIRNPNGTYSRQTVGENYIETKKGLIREDKWTELAFQAVKENGDLSLLEAVEEHVKSTASGSRKAKSDSTPSSAYWEEPIRHGMILRKEKQNDNMGNLG